MPPSERVTTTRMPTQAVIAIVVLNVLFVIAFLAAGHLERRANRAHVARRQSFLDAGFTWEDAERLATSGYNYNTFLNN